MIRCRSEGRATARMSSIEAWKKWPTSEAAAFLEQKLADKDAAHTKAVDELKAQLNSKSLDGFTSQLEGALKGLRVHSREARNLVRDLKEAGRIKLDEKGQVRLYKEDGSTPWDAPTGKELSEAFAEHLLPAVDPLFILSPVGGGPGEGPGATGTGGAARFDAIRNQVQQQTGAEQTEQGADLIGWK